MQGLTEQQLLKVFNYILCLERKLLEEGLHRLRRVTLFKYFLTKLNAMQTIVDNSIVDVLDAVDYNLFKKW